MSTVGLAADLSSTEKLFFSGDYEQCQRLAAEEVGRGIWNERWWLLLVRCQLATGRYDAARETYEQALKRYASNLQLLLLGRDVYLHCNEPQLARRQLDLLLQTARQGAYRYGGPADLVAIGRCFLLLGEDARQVLELFFDRARKLDASSTDSYLATAELALQKHDYQLAAQMADAAAKLDPQQPDIAWLQARAWASSDPDKATQALERALQLNPRHVPSLLLQVDRLIDMEQFERAEQLLTQILEVNLYHPEAWTWHAVIAHLQGKYQAEGLLRQAALCRWKSNPQVDHLIGAKLSRNYRFAEGARYQQRALTLEPGHLAARFQLAQDLLRLGQEDEGWKLADKVFEDDGYNVVAHNLVTLHDRLRQFRTLERDGLILRMDAREADIYGHQALELLAEARTTLTARYDVELELPIVVEIFPEQKDFAIRTFGLPGGAGFLGVCFGTVITANSPASQTASPANWQAVLWHEFCHVVTLQKTKNKMPRWLSEGISVYEERQRDASWGQRLTPSYREMLLSDELTPVSQLSGAFLQPPSPMHLQFAYFQSSLVVEYLIEKHGRDTLQRILVDLGIGMPINESLGRYVGSLEGLDRDFHQFARQRAESLGPGLTWDREDVPQRASLEQWQQWLADHPDNYWGLRGYAAALVQAQRADEAHEVLQRLLQEYPDDASSLELLAQLHRLSGDAAAEREALARRGRLDSDAVAAYRRLMELAAAAEDWQAVATHANQLVAVNPLLLDAQQMRARACEQLGRGAEAVAALEAMVQLQPPDPAGLHFRLATALAALDRRDEARRHVLMALEDAPRFRAAHRLLLELQPPTVMKPAESAKPAAETPVQENQP
ncbi:MAG: tetratricopeptide repeat protein [Pirellulaceae bacterium]|nr:tetratricopeptide repeat protein [Pirellulaceae bacterium]